MNLKNKEVQMTDRDFNERKELLKKKNVVAVGWGYKEVTGEKTDLKAIICSVIKKEPLADLKKKDVIPIEIRGILTDVKETGTIKALKARTDRWRPALGGVSIGHEWITAGTLGCLVSRKGEVFILSNNHVLADSNNAPLGSPILQPGKYDGGGLIDRIATLESFVPLVFVGSDEGCKIGQTLAKMANFFARKAHRHTRLNAISTREVTNRVDAAIARPVDLNMVKNEILELGKISGWENADLGMKVKKSGRTTGVTSGEITQVDVMTNVQYGEKIALFVDQLMIEPGGFSGGGDSGSAVLSEDNNLVALLFAGSDECTVINPIEFVFIDLEVGIKI